LPNCKNRGKKTLIKIACQDIFGPILVLFRARLTHQETCEINDRILDSLISPGYNSRQLRDVMT
jgi:hypothetical protein